MQVPTVTTEDLLSFHQRHFGRPFKRILPAYHSGGAESSNDTSDEPEHYYQDDNLGYYPDGVKRNLTDEQIAIFRHSEIQRLLLQRERAAEAAEAAVGCLKRRSSGSTDLSDEGEVSANDNEEAEYAKFLEEERKQFAQDTKRKRDQSRNKQQKELHDRTVSTRRRVREMDDGLEQKEVTLDY